MSYFVKAKFPARTVDGVEVKPQEKKRVAMLSDAYRAADSMFDRGALSVTIRPEASRDAD